MSTTLKDFMTILCGHFDNKAQVETLHANGIEFPYCRHINTAVNNKIDNLPENFNGEFMIEESYYTSKDSTHATPHLFLMEVIDDKNVKLRSFDIPDGYTKETFTYDNVTTLDYNTFKESTKFTPAIYTLNEHGVWEGGSVSMFSPVLKFSLFERFSNEVLEVSESMEVNGKKTFGYDYPIEYKRIDS